MSDTKADELFEDMTYVLTGVVWSTLSGMVASEFLRQPVTVTPGEAEGEPLPWVGVTFANGDSYRISVQRVNL